MATTSIFHSATLTSCPNKDLIAAVTSKQQQKQIVEVLRCGHASSKIQKVFRHEGEEDQAEPTCLCFSESGRDLVVGFNDGRLLIFDIDQAKELAHFEQLATSGISDHQIGFSQIVWVNAGFQEQKTAELPHHKHLALLKQSLSSTSDLQAMNQPLSFVLAADEQGCVQVIYRGKFQMANIPVVAGLLVPELNRQVEHASSLIEFTASDFTITRLATTESLNKLAVLSENTQAEQFFSLINTRTLRTRVQAGTHQIHQLLHFQEVQQLISKTLNECRDNWKKFYFPFKMNMQILQKSYIKARPEISNPNVMADDFLHYLSGEAPLMGDCLMMFIKKELANTQILGRLDEKCQLELQSVEKMVQNTLLPAVEVLAGLAAQIEASSSSCDLLPFVSYLHSTVYTMAEELSEIKKGVHNLLVFLNHQVLKLYQAQKDPENPSDQAEIANLENAKSHLASQDADLKILTSFLKKGDSFIMLHDFHQFFDYNADSSPGLDSDLKSKVQSSSLNVYEQLRSEVKELLPSKEQAPGNPLGSEQDHLFSFQASGFGRKTVDPKGTPSTYAQLHQQKRPFFQQPSLNDKPKQSPSQEETVNPLLPRRVSLLRLMREVIECEGQLKEAVSSKLNHEFKLSHLLRVGPEFTILDLQAVEEEPPFQEGCAFKNFHESSEQTSVRLLVAPRSMKQLLMMDLRFPEEGPEGACPVLARHLIIDLPGTVERGRLSIDSALITLAFNNQALTCKLNFSQLFDSIQSTQQWVPLSSGWQRPIATTSNAGKIRSRGLAKLVAASQRQQAVQLVDLDQFLKMKLLPSTQNQEQYFIVEQPANENRLAVIHFQKRLLGEKAEVEEGIEGVEKLVGTGTIEIFAEQA